MKTLVFTHTKLSSASKHNHQCKHWQTATPLSKRNAPSLSQQRRCSASFCMRVLTERAAAAPDSVLVFPFSRGWTNEALLASVTCNPGAFSGERWWLVEFEGIGCMFSELEAGVSTLLGQSLFDGDGFVLGFPVQVRVFKQISIQTIENISRGSTTL